MPFLTFSSRYIFCLIEIYFRQVFAGVYAADQGEYTALRNAIDKLTLNDSSVEVNIDTRFVLNVIKMTHIDFTFQCSRRDVYHL